MKVKSKKQARPIFYAETHPILSKDSEPVIFRAFL